MPGTTVTEIYTVTEGLVCEPPVDANTSILLKCEPEPPCTARVRELYIAIELALLLDLRPPRGPKLENFLRYISCTGISNDQRLSQYAAALRKLEAEAEVFRKHYKLYVSWWRAAFHTLDIDIYDSIVADMRQFVAPSGVEDRGAALARRPSLTKQITRTLSDVAFPLYRDRSSSNTLRRKARDLPLDTEGPAGQSPVQSDLLLPCSYESLPPGTSASRRSHVFIKSDSDSVWMSVKGNTRRRGARVLPLDTEGSAGRRPMQSDLLMPYSYESLPPRATASRRSHVFFKSDSGTKQKKEQVIVRDAPDSRLRIHRHGSLRGKERPFSCAMPRQQSLPVSSRAVPSTQQVPLEHSWPTGDRLTVPLLVRRQSSMPVGDHRLSPLRIGSDDYLNHSRQVIAAASPIVARRGDPSRPMAPEVTTLNGSGTREKWSIGRMIRTSAQRVRRFSASM